MSPRRERRSAPAARPQPAQGGTARVFAALGDATRLRLVALLCASGALSITQLTAATAITRQGVTKHLRVLARVGLVRDLKVGRERRFEFDPRPLDAARRSLDSIARQWDAALHRLKAAVESSG